MWHGSNVMPITYRDAGVDIDAADELVRRIGPLARGTRTANVVSGVGGFAGLCSVPKGLADPVLVSGTDGVGTKLKIAFATGVHDTVGIDLVAMSVNDVITLGARPLFFLDYFATGRLDVDVGEAVVRGVAEGCRQADCALLGGETAELPGMYPDGEYDLAGFAVGVVDRASILDRQAVAKGDVLIGVASSGLHSNGFSLARRVLLDRMGLALDGELADLGCTVGEALLVPTKIYARATAALCERCGDRLHGIAHITGGGLVDNLPRVIPDGLGARIDLQSFARPRLFTIIAEGGPVEESELRRTFNLGVGLVVIVAPSVTDDAVEALRTAGDQAWVLGEIVAGQDPRLRFD